MEIRRAKPDDTNAILQLWKAWEATTTATENPDGVRRATEHPAAVFLLAVADGQIVGSLIGTFDGWRGNMYRLAVHPSYRRQGIGRRLVRRVEEVFAEWGVRRITALVEKDRSSAAQFWAAVGFPREEHTAPHVGTLDAEQA